MLGLIANAKQKQALIAESLDLEFWVLLVKLRFSGQIGLWCLKPVSHMATFPLATFV